MVHRVRPPNEGFWNGLGGKIKEGETPIACVLREMKEEANLDIRGIGAIRFSGIVTWTVQAADNMLRLGMYCYIAEIPADYSVWEGSRSTEEGDLEWKPLSWVCNSNNAAVVSNIPLFLPRMIKDGELQEFRMVYDDRGHTHSSCYPLPEALTGTK
jgi:8-oxo-dGTP diphosphatase